MTVEAALDGITVGSVGGGGGVHGGRGITVLDGDTLHFCCNFSLVFFWICANSFISDFRRGFFLLVDVLFGFEVVNEIPVYLVGDNKFFVILAMFFSS